MTEETKHETSTTELSSLDIAKPVFQMTDSIIGQCMVEFDVCPLRASNYIQQQSL